MTPSQSSTVRGTGMDPGHVHPIDKTSLQNTFVTLFNTLQTKTYPVPVFVAFASMVMTLSMILVMVCMTALHHVSAGTHQAAALALESLLQEVGGVVNLFREATFVLAWLLLYNMVLMWQDVRAATWTIFLCFVAFLATRVVLAINSVALWYGSAIPNAFIWERTLRLVGCAGVRVVLQGVATIVSMCRKPKQL